MDNEGRLEAFADRMERLAGGNLVSLLLYGSAAVPGARPKDINLLVVLRKADAEDLAVFRPLLRGEGRRLKVRAVFLTEEDLRRSSDVFPLEHLEMRAGYRVLRGADALKDLRLERGNLRHEVEYQARVLLLRLRAFAAEHGPAKVAFPALCEAASTLALLYRHATSFLPSLGTPSVVTRLVETKREGRLPRGRGRAEEFRELMSACEALVRAADTA